MRDHRWPGGRTEAERNREGPIRAVNGGGASRPRRGEPWPRGGLGPGSGRGDPLGSKALTSPTIFPGQET